MNLAQYPRLHFNEMYLLEGGYKSFVGEVESTSYCDPHGYVPMRHKSFINECKLYKNAVFDKKSLLWPWKW
jgi:hypothetical protein